MKKYPILSGLAIVSALVITSTTAIAQQQTQSVSLTNIDPTQPAFTASNNSGDLSSPYMFSITGIKNMSTSGNKKFATDWLNGNVLFKSGKQIANAELEFDVASNELHFRQNNKAYVYSEPVKAFSLVALIKNESKTFLFKTGYPDFGRQNDNTFYLVLTSGKKFDLVKYLSVTVDEQFNYNSNSERTYKIMEDYFVYDAAARKMLLLNAKNAQSLKKIFPQYENAIDKAMSEKKEKRWSEQELVNLVNELNQ